MSGGFLEAVGDGIRDARAELGITQAAIAEELGVSVSAVSSWERAEATMGAPSYLRMHAYFKRLRLAQRTAQRQREATEHEAVEV
jgi:transcriptional regulator with XRE-family HTH domain